MKQLTCEMCGNTDLIKQDGVYVCQSCGAKYSIEEAKKMMVEGTVDVTGSTVKVDISDELSNLYQLARRAKSNNNVAQAAKYYDMILVKEPTSWEAVFYSVYYHALNCKIIQIKSSVNSIKNSLDSVFTLIACHLKDEGEKKAATIQVALSSIAATDVFFAGAKSAHDSSLESFKKYHNHDIYCKAVHEFIDRTYACMMLLMHLETKLRTHYPEDEKIKGVALAALEKATTLVFEFYKALDSAYGMTPEVFEPAESLCDLPVKLIQEHYKPNYTNPFETIQKPEVKPEAPSGGCYVATAVYGSYDCPQVWTLRRFRDYTLAETWYGRAFIRTYYAISPTLVKWFGHTEWFKKMWKGKLDRIVANLKANGVEDTPYKDKQW